MPFPEAQCVDCGLAAGAACNLDARNCGYDGRASRVTPPRICDTVPAKESAMFHWLVRLWRRLDAMIRQRAVVPPVSYRRSNLHGRRR